MSIQINDVLLDGKKTHIHIDDNHIAEIGKKREGEEVIDGNGMAAFPGFVNTHTHAAMTLLRGFADDIPLFEWLQNHIWPVEAKLEPEDIYWGTKLAVLEMIKSGTTAFNDMYFMLEESAKAVDEMGVRATLAYGFIDLFDDDKREKEIKSTKKTIRNLLGMKNPRIKTSLGPHAVYTVSRKSLEWMRDYSQENNIPVHMHLSETEKENKDCIEKNGVRPFRMLQDIGLVNNKLVAAHCVWLNEREIKLMSENGAHISHNPISNAKLAVGRAMPYHLMIKAGANVSLGTDGAASNNNLDMSEEIKFAAVIQKMMQNDQTLLPAYEGLKITTENGAKAVGINAGKIEEGKLADLILVDTKNHYFTPNHNSTANLIYSSSGDCIRTTICNGKILMRDRKVEGEEEIINNASKRAFALVERAKQ